MVLMLKLRLTYDRKCLENVNHLCHLKVIIDKVLNDKVLKHWNYGTMVVKTILTKWGNFATLQSFSSVPPCYSSLAASIAIKCKLDNYVIWQNVFYRMGTYIERDAERTFWSHRPGPVETGASFRLGRCTRVNNP